MAGRGGIPLQNILHYIASVFKSRANRVCASSCDGLVLRMHYRWTSFLLIGCYFIVFYSLYNHEVIVCVSHFNAAIQVRLDYLNVCLSYPYVEEENGARRYLLFYRWISWTFIFLAAIYYIPRKLSKNFDNRQSTKLLEDLAANAHRYDQGMEKMLVEKATNYYVVFNNLHTHNGLYWKFLSINVLALVVDIFVMLYLDFLLQGKFLRYGIESYPFQRDPQCFTDKMSTSFPPFALCEIDKDNELVASRKEIFGCHLTMMELYEKIFLALWAWLVVLICSTLCYIIFLLSMWLPFIKAYLLRAAKPAHALEKNSNVIGKVIGHCKIGDIYLLYRLKSHLTHVRFYELMINLSDPDLYKKSKQAQVPNGVTVQNTAATSLPSFAQSMNNPQGWPPIYQQHLHQSLAHPGIRARH